MHAEFTLGNPLMYHHLENPASIEYDLMNTVVTVIMIYDLVFHFPVAQNQPSAHD